MTKAIIFDFNRTIYDPDSDSLMEGIIELLETCKNAGFGLFLVAKGSEERMIKIQELGISNFFKRIIVRPEKTKAEFDEIVNHCEPGTEFYVLGDRTRREIRFGNECGMTTIWFKNGKFAEEAPRESIEEPDFIIFDISEAWEKIVS